VEEVDSAVTRLVNCSLTRCRTRMYKLSSHRYFPDTWNVSPSVTMRHCPGSKVRRGAAAGGIPTAAASGGGVEQFPCRHNSQILGITAFSVHSVQSAVHAVQRLQEQMGHKQVPNYYMLRKQHSMSRNHQQARQSAYSSSGQSSSGHTQLYETEITRQQPSGKRESPLMCHDLDRRGDNR
jgi:hypothetical protein